MLSWRILSNSLPETKRFWATKSFERKDTVSLILCPICPGHWAVAAIKEGDQSATLSVFFTSMSMRREWWIEVFLNCYWQRGHFMKNISKSAAFYGVKVCSLCVIKWVKWAKESEISMTRRVMTEGWQDGKIKCLVFTLIYARRL